ncbi:uncharacterized protein LOC135357213 [Latimeria chalumnae]|uniref:uncharacterized protein LOC135357213 n=1 Tax=Latimeria chalumnae TaxID=7897 RepID=UPI00313C28EF
MSSESGGLPPGQAVPVDSPETSEKEWGNVAVSKDGNIEFINVDVSSLITPVEGPKKANGKVIEKGNGKENEKERVIVGPYKGAILEENKGKPEKSLYSDILKGNRDFPNASSLDHRRKNVVRLYYTGEIIPDRESVGKDLIINSLHFSPLHVFAFIHISGSREFDISFRNVSFLDLFWQRYSEVKNDPIWKDFQVIRISQNTSRQITILFKTESVPASDILFWLKRHCDTVGELKPIYDKNGFWIGGYKVFVKLHSTNFDLQHLPNFITIGRDRGHLFYPGQPKVCFKCGSGRHFGTACTKQLCSRCGVAGHFAKDCKKEVTCNLCNQTGHLYVNCPKSERNGLPEALCSGLSTEEQMDLAAEELEEAVAAGTTLVANEEAVAAGMTMVVDEEAVAVRTTMAVDDEAVAAGTTMAVDEEAVAAGTTMMADVEELGSLASVGGSMEQSVSTEEGAGGKEGERSISALLVDLKAPVSFLDQGSFIAGPEDVTGVKGNDGPEEESLVAGLASADWGLTFFEEELGTRGDSGGEGTSNAGVDCKTPTESAEKVGESKQGESRQSKGKVCEIEVEEEVGVRTRASRSRKKVQEEDRFEQVKGKKKKKNQ